MPATEELRDAPDLALYGGEDPRDLPRYTYRDAAVATSVPFSTVRAWARGTTWTYKSGRRVFRPIISPPGTDDTRLSFYNVVEIQALRALRVDHGVRMKYVRQALGIAEKKYGIEHLLRSPKLLTSAGRLFIETYSEYVDLSPAEQFAMRAMLQQYMTRVNFDASERPLEFYPTDRLLENQGRRLVLVTPFVSFGAPNIARVGVSTLAIAERLNAGEEPATIIRDYGLEDYEFKEAIAYEGTPIAA